ncbi:MAG TPA: hypothetical protein VMU84_16030, partial [Thermoanaerobaculia bacterium]|nr:hypothetical protein [Thermoanaerobaculia bacterium]
MKLGIDGFSYADLNDYARLRDLAGAFDRFVEEHDADLFRRFDAYRQGIELTSPDESALLIAVARELALFLTQLFHIDPGVAALKSRAVRDAQVARLKKDFVSRRVAKVQKVERDVSAAANLLDAHADDPELALALTVNRLLDREKESPGSAKDDLDLLAEWAAVGWKEGRFAGWTSFRLPQPLVFDRLVPTAPIDDVRFGGDPHHFRKRDGFKLTDARMSQREIADEGDPIGALALVIVDNPMCPGTGHRICNDCMKACIFQKQEPVNIPQVETRVLTETLALPWGLEIYQLLTRWNPLNVHRPHMRPYNGRNVLVVGLGPAGYTLAHYLLNEGFGVVGVDGLQIEPLPISWTGANGKVCPVAIR